MTLPRICPEGPQLRVWGCVGQLPLPKGFNHRYCRSICTACQTKPPKVNLPKHTLWRCGGLSITCFNLWSSFYHVECHAGVGMLAYSAVKTRENRTNVLIKTGSSEVVGCMNKVRYSQGNLQCPLQDPPK